MNFGSPSAFRLASLGRRKDFGTMAANVTNMVERPDANVCLTRAGVRWVVVSSFKDLFLDAGGLKLAEWLRDGHATVVKRGPHRMVYRVELPEVSFFVKQNRIPDARSWLRQLIRPAKACMEYRRVLAVAARGVPTVEPLAVGETDKWVGAGESVLITRSLPDTMQLNVFLETVLPGMALQRRQCIRKRLAVALGRFIAHLHNKGILHNDLHCGNLLIRLQDDEPYFYLIDLQSVRLGTPLTWQQSKANLVMFNRWLSLRASRADRLRFWLAYQSCRDATVWGSRAGRLDPHTVARVAEIGSGSKTSNESEKGREGQTSIRIATRHLHPQIRELVLELETATRRSNERFWRRRELRCLQITRHTRRFRSRSLRGFAVSDLDPQLLALLREDPDAPFALPDAVLLKDSRSARVVEFMARIGGELRPVIYKRFGVTKWYDPALALIRPSPPLRSWLYGHSLRERGLPTARPLAFFHRRRWGLCQEGYLLLEKVRAAGDLRTCLDRLQSLSAPTGRAWLRARLGQLARLIRELHRRHLAHRDLKAANILEIELDGGAKEPADRSTSPDEWQAPPFCLIDLVGVTCPRRLRRTSRIKNLARLHASFHDDPRLTRSDKLRFLRTYLQWGIFGKAGWKNWWRAIEKATARKIRLNQHRNRPLA
jgi:tRNA A-37 threonylcarbamoyl transferase component Bud32